MKEICLAFDILFQHLAESREDKKVLSLLLFLKGSSLFSNKIWYRKRHNHLHCRAVAQQAQLHPTTTWGAFQKLLISIQMKQICTSGSGNQVSVFVQNCPQRTLMPVKAENHMMKEWTEEWARLRESSGGGPEHKLMICRSDLSAKVLQALQKKTVKKFLEIKKDLKW